VALTVALKRAYEPPAAGDGPRVLVDRLWPRGVSKQDLRIAAWLRDIGPSTALRAWFGHDPAKWGEFRRRYRAELAGKRALLEELAGYARGGRMTLVFGARDPVHNQAAVLREVLLGRPAAGTRSAAAPRRTPSRRGGARVLRRLRVQTR
jgi:uncharacterized protein YeaO (DUF488 family)